MGSEIAADCLPLPSPLRLLFSIEILAGAMAHKYSQGLDKVCYSRKCFTQTENGPHQDSAFIDISEGFQLLDYDLPKTPTSALSTASTTGTFVGTDRESPKKGWTLSTYPLAAFVMLFWIIFTAGTIVTLELSSIHTFERWKSRYSPWWANELPTGLLTVFAQGHIAVTSMYLARLAISALQHPDTAPKSWAELLWMADRNWQGPFGFVSLTLDKCHLGSSIPLSSTFKLFLITCALALPTPLFLSRTYAARPIDYRRVERSTAAIIDPYALTLYSSTYQMSVGAAAWGTGIPVVQMYNYSTYLPETNYSETSTVPTELAYAGQFQGSFSSDRSEAWMAVMHMDGGCAPRDSNLPTEKDKSEERKEWCAKYLPNAQSWDGNDLHSRSNGVNISTEWCSTHNDSDPTWMLDPSKATVRALIWLNISNGTNASSSFFDCNVTFQLGEADVIGRSFTFDRFEAKVPESYNRTAIERRAYPAHIQHPLYAALKEITLTFAGSEISNERSLLQLRMYGFVPSPQPGRQIHWDLPSAKNLATSLWNGALHMGASIAALTRRPNQRIYTIEYYHYTARTRDWGWAALTVALLVLWAAMLVYCTFRMLRRTFAPSLNSYAAARLLVDYPGLIDGHCCGELGQNKSLNEVFRRVGDAFPDEPVGHIVAGGVGVLRPRRREYAGYP